MHRFWFRLLPLLVIVSLITTGQAGIVVAESAGEPTASGSSICGSKFNDVNGNGVQDAGEPFLPGWTIQLLDAAGNVVATTITSTETAASPPGRFCFNDLLVRIRCKRWPRQAQDRDLDLRLSGLLLSQFAGCQVNDARSRFGWGFGRCAQASLEEEEQDDGNQCGDRR